MFSARSPELARERVHADHDQAAVGVTRWKRTIVGAAPARPLGNPAPTV